ncbi:MAG TPA: MaoC/PaaZ C-terminal domain-containing protein [Candidatus Limnocylindria bacterium]|nr:MaoC/PaaZ C-terminal domain-containing protein [Candidatus Limnocylindria bacterium]
MSANGGGHKVRLGGLQGGEALVSRGRTITEADVVGFAALSGDWHPQHADATWAAESRFGRRVAHGMLVLSYSIGLMPLDPSRVEALRGLRDVVFKRPVFIGDTIRAEGRVEAVTPLDGETALVHLGWRIVNQHDESVARAKLAIVWRLDQDLSSADVASRAAGEEAGGESVAGEVEEVFL